MNQKDLEDFMTRFMTQFGENLQTNLVAGVQAQIAPLVNRLSIAEQSLLTHEEEIVGLKNQLQEEITKNEKERTRNDQERRKRNLLVFNMEEEGDEDNTKLERKVLIFIRYTMKVTCTSEDIDYISRLGGMEKNKRPVLIRFTTLKKKIEILKSRANLKDSPYSLDEDFSKEVREKRKSLLPELKKLRNENKIAVLRYDQIVVLKQDKKNTRQGGGDAAMDTHQGIEQERKRMRYPPLLTPARLTVDSGGTSSGAGNSGGGSSGGDNSGGEMNGAVSGGGGNSTGEIATASTDGM